MNKKAHKALILLSNSEGRATFGRETLNRCYPLLRPIAAVYRRTLLRKVRIISVIGSLENTRDEKAKMLEQLSPQSTAILNADDPHVMQMATRTRAKVLTFGSCENADVRAANIEISPPNGMKFDVEISNEIYSLRISLLGRHMVYPVLAALAVALAEDLNVTESCERLQNVESLEARMHSIALPNGAVLIRDDYKATRESVWGALETLAEYPARRKCLVLGGVSEICNKESNSFYRDLGSRISQSADYGYLRLDKNSFRRCLGAAAAGGMDRKRLTRIKLDPLSIIPLLPDNLGKGDVILIKGKPDYKISRLSLALMGKHVVCRKMSCPVSTSYCDNCSALSGR